MAPNSQLIASSDGAKIYADAAGDPHRPSIIFIHGLALSGVVFNDIFANEKYKREFYLVRYDLRGHGQSAKPETIEGYSSKLFADDFAAVMKAFNLRKPILVGWSYGSTVVADIATNLPADTIAGAVYLAALPYIGSIMGRVGTPTILGMLPGLFCEDSVTTCLKTTLEFTDSLFIDPALIDWETKCLWIGISAHQTPAHRQFSASRPQDPAKLHELGRNGLPLLVMSGTKDKQVDGEKVVEEMKPYFKDLEVAMIEKGGSHAVFFENREEVMDRITKFANRVLAL